MARPCDTRCGLISLSLTLSPAYGVALWDSLEGARRTGRHPSRHDWRIVREIFVTDTDEEAPRNCVRAAMDRMMRADLDPDRAENYASAAG